MIMKTSLLLLAAVIIFSAEVCFSGSGVVYAVDDFAYGLAELAEDRRQLAEEEAQLRQEYEELRQEYLREKKEYHDVMAACLEELSALECDTLNACLCENRELIAVVSHELVESCFYILAPIPSAFYRTVKSLVGKISEGLS